MSGSPFYTMIQQYSAIPFNIKIARRKTSSRVDLHLGRAHLFRYKHQNIPATFFFPLITTFFAYWIAAPLSTSSFVNRL